MKQKFYDSQGIELSLNKEIQLAYWFIECPIKEDYVIQFYLDADETGKLIAKEEYRIAKFIYNRLKKIFKDKEICSLAMWGQNMIEEGIE